MKKIFFLLAIVFTTTAYAKGGPTFSAFSVGDNLYLTILGDDCNGFGGNLVVDDKCNVDRKTDNIATVCEAEVRITSTRMACRKNNVPVVVTMSLIENKVASEAEILNLTRNGQKVKVRLNR